MKLTFIKVVFLLYLISLHLSINAQMFYRTGSSGNLNVRPTPGIVLAGGGTDNNDAMRWMLQRANGGDVVVLRASGSDGYNNYFFSQLEVKVNSVTSIVIQSAQQARNPQVEEILRQAEVVFIAGGNQWNYVNYWKDTPVIEALDYLIHEKGITIGGTSAGMAVLSEVVFTAENNTIWSTEALGNPFHFRMKLDNSFLTVPFLENTVTDTHFNRPESDGFDRKGRTIGFLSRMVADWRMTAKAIACNERTAVAIDEKGMASVFGNPSGDEYAYFLQLYNHGPEVIENNKQLTWNRENKAVKVYKIRGDREGTPLFNLNNWVSGTGGTWEFWHTVDGKLYENPFQTDGAWIRFEVRDSISGNPLPNATLTINESEIITPSEFGLYNLENVAEGTSISWKAQAEGYSTKQGNIDVSGSNIYTGIKLARDLSSSNNGVFRSSQVKIYPNPTDGNAYIDITGFTGDATLRVYCSMGKMLSEEPLSISNHSLYTLNTGYLNQGIYFVEVISENTRKTLKLIKK
jgi:cyanophycinase-like exopeptidase